MNAQLKKLNGLNVKPDILSLFKPYGDRFISRSQHVAIAYVSVMKQTHKDFKVMGLLLIKSIPGCRQFLTLCPLVPVVVLVVGRLNVLIELRMVISIPTPQRRPPALKSRVVNSE